MMLRREYLSNSAAPPGPCALVVARVRIAAASTESTTNENHNSKAQGIFRLILPDVREPDDSGVGKAQRSASHSPRDGPYKY
jgi:hypothetical protein